MKGIPSQKKILVIEDEHDLRESLAEILTFEGYRAYTAINGKQGVEMAKKAFPDLILCDILMPDLNGFEVLKQLTKDSFLPTVPFIFLTALDERTHIRQGMELGADDYLIKPFTRKELLKAIDTRMRKLSELKAYVEQMISKTERQVSNKLHFLQEELKTKNHLLSDFSVKNGHLKEQLKEKELELIKDTFQAIEMNNTIQNLKSLLQKELLNTHLPEGSKNILLKLKKKIEENTVLRNNWAIFLLKFRQVYPRFIHNLTSLFSGLTQYELVFISAHMQGLNTKQIADLLNISDDSVRKSRYRTKKKLGLNKEDDFLSFIRSLNSKTD